VRQIVVLLLSLQIGIGVLPFTPFLGVLTPLNTTLAGISLEHSQGFALCVRGGQVWHSSSQLRVHGSWVTEASIQVEFTVSQDSFTLYGGAGILYAHLNYSKFYDNDSLDFAGEAFAPCFLVGVRLAYPIELDEFGLWSEVKLLSECDLSWTLDKVGGWSFEAGLFYRWTP